MDTGRTSGIPFDIYGDVLRYYFAEDTLVFLDGEPVMIAHEEDLPLSMKGPCQLGQVKRIVSLRMDEVPQEDDGGILGRYRVIMSLNKAGVHLRKVTERPPVVRKDAFMSEMVVGGEPGRTVKTKNITIHLNTLVINNS